MRDDETVSGLVEDILYGDIHNQLLEEALRVIKYGATKKRKAPSTPMDHIARGDSSPLEILKSFVNKASTEKKYRSVIFNAMRENYIYKEKMYEKKVAEQKNMTAKEIDTIKKTAQSLRRDYKEIMGIKTKKENQPSSDTNTGNQEMSDKDVADDMSGYNFFNDISGNLKEIRKSTERFEVLQEQALVLKGRFNAEGTTNTIEYTNQLKLMRDSLRELEKYEHQSDIVTAVVLVVSSFLKYPPIIRTQFLNFMITGPAGIGKTTMIEAISKVFAAFGLFIYGDLIEAGRNDLVGEYLGQTFGKTMSFLTSHIDAGIIFIDEAYALTQWENGKPDMYGSEASTALVQFMTKYKGLYCLFVAGYSKEMNLYFLPSNSGLDRRFRFKLEMTIPSSKTLLDIFKNKLKSYLIPLPPLKRSQSSGSDALDAILNRDIAVRELFKPEAWEILLKVFHYSFEPESNETTNTILDESSNTDYEDVTITYKYPDMHKLFDAFAGSVTNFAEDVSMLLLNDYSFDNAAKGRDANGAAVVGDDYKVNLGQKDTDFVDLIIETRMKSIFQNISECKKEYEEIKRKEVPIERKLNF